MSEKINKGFNIEKKVLDERIDFSTQIPEECRIVPLKQIKRTEKIEIMNLGEMEAFLKHIPLMESKDIFPYKCATISRHISGASGLHVSQTFAQRTKLLSILEGLNSLYDGFCFPGLSRRPSHYLFGTDFEGRKVAGIYFPPLLEIVGEQALIIDGNHRMALCEGIGTTSETIIVKGSSVKPPYTGIPWHNNLVDEKPPLSERYVDFNPSLLKDFDYVGIDG